MGYATAKGTKAETDWLPLVRLAWPKAYRTGKTLGPKDFGDYGNVDNWLIEAKWRKNLAIKQWVREILHKIDEHGNGTNPWILIARQDRRSLPVDLMIMPVEQGFALLGMLFQLAKNNGIDPRYIERVDPPAQ